MFPFAVVITRKSARRWGTSRFDYGEIRTKYLFGGRRNHAALLPSVKGLTIAEIGRGFAGKEVKRSEERLGVHVDEGQKPPQSMHERKRRGAGGLGLGYLIACCLRTSWDDTFLRMSETVRGEEEALFHVAKEWARVKRSK